ncbi:hypothetical protein HO173_006298 [Letharia columbiana]|uniref:Alcohol dehydrogenase-like N-terminal domain-containing protein n=1 Tax=Letharia columbiana TaxID=112416 RepID=A0A8H6FVL7_9LECA|nr:uncharacterized protein HO173_006298 [Letharia columbiana]KAF6235615.1 hypothetical protein HO173_006298 [Letharia columbiana]
MHRLSNLSRSFTSKSSSKLTTIRQASMAGKHQAAILPQKGGPLSVVDRATLEPGPNDVLVEAKAIAVNPVDYLQRDFGMPPPSYPAVVGSDVAGLVVKVGSNVSNAPPSGSRAIAFASSFYQGGSQDHGAFQKYVLAQSEGVIALPDALSFDTKNHECLKKLGADVVFDYKASDVVSQIIDTVKKDGVTLRTAICVVEGSLQPTLDVLRHTMGDAVAKVAHAPPLLPGAPTLEGAEVKFVLPPMDPAERSDHMYKCFHVWLRDGLNSGTVLPSPRVRIEAGGLQGLNKALNTSRAGVSGTKIVVQV